MTESQILGTAQGVPPSTTQPEMHERLSAKKQRRRPRPQYRIALWLSTSRQVDGLWVGTTESKPRRGLDRVVEALELIKRHTPLHYARVIRHLDRVWVHLNADSTACYEAEMNGCILDERFVLSAETKIESIASAIVHEATHARMDRWGIGYDEEKRTKIEAICLRREADFVGRLPDSEQLQVVAADTIEAYADNHDFFSDASFQQRIDAGNVETLRYLGMPEWLIACVLKIRAFVETMRRWSGRLTGRSQRPA